MNLLNCSCIETRETEYNINSLIMGDKLKMDDFQKENIIIEKTPEEKKIELIVSVLKAKRELDLANKNFETAESGLIDYYVYQIKASKSKLDFLVNKAKQKGISLNMIEEIYFRKNQVS